MHKLLSGVLSALLLSGGIANAGESDSATNDEDINVLAQSAAPITCNVSGNDALVARVSDGFPIGASFERGRCFEAIAAANQGVVCSKGGRNFGIFRIQTAAPVGINGIIPFEECLALTRAATANTVCVPDGPGSTRFTQFNITTGAPTSQGLSFRECISLGG